MPVLSRHDVTAKILLATAWSTQPHLYLADNTYVTIPEGWMTQRFVPYFDRYMRAIRRGKYEVGRNDCDDFGRRFAVQMEDSFFASGRATADAPAAFEMWYNDRREGGHSIALVITENGVRFVEPQQGRGIVVLDADERKSVCFVR